MLKEVNSWNLEEHSDCNEIGRLSFVIEKETVLWLLVTGRYWSIFGKRLRKEKDEVPTEALSITKVNVAFHSRKFEIKVFNNVHLRMSATGRSDTQIFLKFSVLSSSCT